MKRNLPKKSHTRDPMARDLQTPKYRTKTVESRKKNIDRKAKHKNRPCDHHPLAA